VKRVRCHIALAEGRYKRSATEAALRDVLRRVLSDSLCELAFDEPKDDVAVAGEVVVLSESRLRDWADEEAVRDAIVTALLDRLQPEYESQVEVEILDEPEDACDDPFGHLQDEMDDSYFNTFEDRIQRVF
jgi:hypothetical protein